MSHRFLSVLSVALLVAAAASFVLYRLMARPAAPPVPEASVVVAARDLEPGTAIKEGDLRMGKHVGALPAGAVRRIEPLLGRGVRSGIYRDEVVVESRLAPKGVGAGLAAMIPEGMRAVAVRVNDVVGVAGFAAPGMRVDVLMSGNPPGGAAAGSVTRTLLQNISVLSAGQNFQKEADGKPVTAQVVNLLVTPEQAEMLSLASHHATIQLVLRNPMDSKVAEPPGAVLGRLYLGLASGQPGGRTRAPETTRAAAPAPSPPPPPPPPPPVIVEMFHGVKKAELRFAREENP